MATFILAGAMLMLVVLFDAGLKHLQASTQVSRALLASESLLERARKWCQNPVNFHNPASYPGLGAFATQPGAPSWLESRLELERGDLYSPDFGSEMILPALQRRVLAGSTLRARATSRWGAGVDQSVSLVADIPVPDSGWHATLPLRITMTPAGTSVGQGQGRDFTVSAFDGANRPMTFVTFGWTVVACTSDGTLESQSRDGARARFVHHLPRPGGGFGFGPPGEVWVQVRARFWGVEKSEKVVLNLL